MEQKLQSCKSIAACALMVLAGACQPAAQPLWSTKQNVGDRIVLKDGKIRNKYYYGPGALRLSTNQDGKPVFELIAMRYTGTALAGTKEEKRFTNLLQFGVSMQPITAAELESLRKTLRLPPAATLSPLPIQHLESVIVSGIGAPAGADESGRFRKQAASQEQGEAAAGVYWTERTFTVPLNKHEAQILWDQQANGRLIMSLNYAFYANVLAHQAQELKITGDSAMVADLKSSLEGLQNDTALVSEIVRAGVVNILIDLKKYPDALKKIDLNENSIPPAYAALEVKCFDFSMDVRPDLAFKSVEIEGSALTGQPVLVKAKFSQKQPDITSRFVSFPYALRMDKPLRFKVIEIPYDGNRYETPWAWLEMGSNLVDVTTPQKANPVERVCLDVEILPEFMEEKSVEAASVHLVYRYQGKERVQTVTLASADGQYFKNICITYEKQKPVQYFISKKYADGHIGKGFLKPIPSDGYLLISN